MDLSEHEEDSIEKQRLMSPELGFGLVHNGLGLPNPASAQ